MNTGIYQITSPSGKSYIGSSKDLQKRWKQHKWFLQKGNHHNRHLQNAWNKYEGNLGFKPLIICHIEDLLLYEQLIIDNLKPEYNIAKSANKAFYALGIKRSQETKDKISKALTGKSRKGRPLSETEKKAIKKRMMGNTIWTGRSHSEESKLKMRKPKESRYVSSQEMANGCGS